MEFLFKEGEMYTMFRQQAKILSAVMMVFVLFLAGFQVPTLAATQIGNGTISVEGSAETGTLLTETPITYEQNETAFDALVKAVGIDNVKFHDDPTYGRSLDGIKGLEASGNYFWGFYIDGISSQLGSGSYTVHDGDKLSFRYVDYTQPSKTVTLKVIDNKNTVTHDFSGWSSFTIVGDPTPTALELIQVALGKDNVGLSDNNTITTIDGLAAQGSSKWTLLVNGKEESTGADGYHLLPNDQISFQYQTVTLPSGNTNTVGITTPTKAVPADKLQKAVDSASQYVLNNPIGEWEAIFLKQAGKTIPTSYLENVTKVIQDKGGKFSKITDTERYTLGILAAGGDPTNIGGINLVESIYNGNVTKQGLNGVAYALIALDSASFKIPDTATWTREKLVNELVDKQNTDKGWSWDGSPTSDPDTTAMVLTALAPYKDQAGVKEKVEAAVNYLSAQYLASKIDNSSTAAQIITGLSALGLDANGSLFTKDNVSLIQYLLSFQNADGGFDYQGGAVSDNFSTSQGIQGIVAYQIFVKGKGSIYQLPLTGKTSSVPTPTVETPQTQTNSVEGHLLPNTATNSENLFLLGVFLVIIGGNLVYLKNRKKA